MTHSEFKKRIKIIKNHFKCIEYCLNTLPEGICEGIYDYSIQEYSKLGLKKSREILKKSKVIYNTAKENYDI